MYVAHHIIPCIILCTAMLIENNNATEKIIEIEITEFLHRLWPV